MFKAVIVGRPNVGKSTLFNRFVGRRKAIIHESPGTTRDRNEHEIVWRDKKFIITDTAGWSDQEFDFSKEMAQQLDIALNQADIVLFVTDAQSGIHPLDEQIADHIRRKKCNVLLVANKVDDNSQEAKGYEFYGLGFDDIIFISAAHGRAINDLLDKIWKRLKYDRRDKVKKEALKIAIVGRPNVGKSSFINAVLKEERTIVSGKAGTTRDALHIETQVDGKDYVLIDTAGIHRGSKPKDDMQYLSTLCASRAIDDCDVAVLTVDAEQGVSETDAKIARMIVEAGRAVIIAVNKWDLVEDKEDAAKYFDTELKRRMKFMDWADIVFISAKTGQRINKIFERAQDVYKQFCLEVDPARLNEVIGKAISDKPFIWSGKVLKLREWAQIGSKPPLFMFGVNNIKLVHFSYERFLENRLRDAFGFKGSPIVLKFRKQKN